MRKPKHVFKLDIEKYFHNINTDILITQLERRIKDPKYMSLIKDLLNTANNGTGKGIPIGFYSSQWLSNFYLQVLDYHVKQDLGIIWYIRYMDDIIILGNNKRLLHRLKRLIFIYLREKLAIGPNKKYQIFPHAKRHIDFVGYVFKTNTTYLRKHIFKLFKRRMSKLKKALKNVYLCRSYMSLRGWLIHAIKGVRFLYNNETRKFRKSISKYISTIEKRSLKYGLC